MRASTERTVTNIAGAVLLLLVVVILAAVMYVVPAADCQRVGVALNANWMYDPAKGCFLQYSPGGPWIPIDNNRIYQP